MLENDLILIFGLALLVCMSFRLSPSAPAMAVIRRVLKNRPSGRDPRV